MSTKGDTNLNLSDWARRVDPDGKISKIVEILNETNEILDDMVWVEGNLPTGHRTTIRSGLPEPTWRMLNYGVQPKKSRTIPVTDSIGMLENYADVDKDLADLNNNTNQFRLSEDVAFLEGMSQEMASTVIYGNTETDPVKFMGLSPRYNDALTSANKGNILNGGGTGSDNTSVWLVSWSDNTCHGIFPKGKMTGLRHTDKGQETLTDSEGGYYEGYRSHYKWDAGLTLRDWRYVVRIANIDVLALTKDASAGADLIDLMIQAMEILPGNLGKKVFYCNTKIRSFLRRQIKNTSNVNLTLDNVAGKHVLSLDEIPVKKVEAILSTEDTVAFS